MPRIYEKLLRTKVEKAECRVVNDTNSSSLFP
jgi:hypothetical protein